MHLVITSIDGPDDLARQAPIHCSLVRKIPGPDRPDYWLGTWISDTTEQYLIIAARWVGTEIAPAVENLPVGIAYVIDQTLLDDENLEFKKIHYVAIALATETESNNEPKSLTQVLAGNIARSFGMGGPQ